MKFNTCDHFFCGNLNYTTDKYEMVFDTRIETILKINGTPKQICNAYHGFACNPQGMSEGIKNPCKCSRCVNQWKEILKDRKEREVQEK